MDNLKVAIVYDWLDKWGGAERLLLALKEVYPKAVFFTSYRDKEKTSWLEDVKVKESFISFLPAFVKKNRILSFPFYPFAFESFDFSGFDIVISLTAYFAKGVITKSGTLHISYILTPPRFLYYDSGEYLGPLVKRILVPYLSYLKKWDWIAAQRADLVLSISEEVRKRVKEVYNRDSLIVYPAFDVDFWNKVKKKLTRTKMSKKIEQISSNKFFLYVGRLEPYKKVDLFLKIAHYFPNFKFVVVGKGSRENALKRLASSNVIFLQDLTDEELGLLYSKAQALIMPQREEFGYVSLEAIFFELPVVYFKKGGVSEVVGDLGVGFDRQDEESLKTAIEKYLTLSYNLKRAIKAKKEKIIKKFSKQRFKEQFRSLIESNFR